MIEESHSSLTDREISYKANPTHFSQLSPDRRQ